jgi:hypothetical protein
VLSILKYYKHDTSIVRTGTTMRMMHVLWVFTTEFRRRSIV